MYCSIKKKVKIKKKCIGSENVFTSARIALKTFTSTDQNPNWANQTLHHNHLSKEGFSNMNEVDKVKSVSEATGPASRSLSRKKRLGVFLLHPGWDANPLQGYTWVERGTVRLRVLPENTTKCPRPGLEPGQ